MPTSLQIIRRFYPMVDKVTDAKRDVTITITKRDANHSTPKDHSKCAMAAAAVRTLAIDGAIISTRTAYLIKGNTALRFTVPEHVAREIVAFDRGAKFIEGDYTLIKPGPRSPRGSGIRNPGNPAAGKLRHRAYERTADVREHLGSVKP